MLGFCRSFSSPLFHHSIIPLFHFFNYNKAMGGKAIDNPFKDAMNQGPGKIPVLSFTLVVAAYWLLVPNRALGRGFRQRVTSNQ